MANNGLSSQRIQSSENDYQGLGRIHGKGLQAGDNGQAQRRTALGTITSRVNRVQPSRAAKQQPNVFPDDVCDENIYSRKEKEFAGQPNVVQSQGFRIHLDNQAQEISRPQESDSSTHLKLHAGVTTLGPSHPTSRPSQSGFYPINDSIEATDSPMILDTTIDENLDVDCEKKHEDDVTLCVAEYSADIYQYLREAETRSRPRLGYMRKQPDITYTMRSILVDWLVEVGEEYKMHTETLYLAVSYVDRFLSCMSVMRGKLQLVGAASMFLAGKYEEIYPPDIGEFVYITDDTYTQPQVLRMEHLVLKVLSFDVAVPTALCFLQRFAYMCQCDDKTTSLAMYLSELTLLNAEVFLKYLPSTIGAAAMMLANHAMGREPWPMDVQMFSGYQVEQLQPLLQDMQRAWSNAASSGQQAICDKYKNSKNNGVASLLPSTTIPSV
ncbi:PREDICTED: G2/mitotic-specific cyclin-A-like [Priapulus caudatus]|uniref:G2/mitotic-specific cyclin-A-like n=1 Tax=Priapulus caudatus TaxID=37621 RepID=A0ABM1DYJ1_PRICU|nr:PREDICTED: G2/mitotic-specific cyclin-A-like [Priapulus caudatus]